MSETLPETPTAAARGLLLWFAGALAFRCIDTLHDGYWPSLGYGLGAVTVAGIDYKLKAILAGSPKLTKSLNGVAADARWWVGIGIASLLILSLSRFVQEQKWPRVPFFQMAGSQADLQVNRGPTIGTNDKTIAAATAPIQAHLDAANRRIQQLESAIRNAPPPPPPNYDEPRIYTTKSLAEIRAFYDGRTPAQGDVFMADEAGKWIKTDGTIQNVLSGGEVLLTSKDNRGINCFFNQTWRTKLLVLEPNQKINVIGKLRTSENPNMITLDSCEIE